MGDRRASAFGNSNPIGPYLAPKLKLCPSALIQAYGRRGKGRLIRPGAAVVIELELIKIWTQRVEKKRHRGL